MVPGAMRPRALGLTAALGETTPAAAAAADAGGASENDTPRDDADVAAKSPTAAVPFEDASPPSLALSCSKMLTYLVTSTLDLPGIWKKMEGKKNEREESGGKV